MGYKDNVTRLAARLNIVNHERDGLNESDLAIAGLQFHGRGDTVKIRAGRLNKGARLLIQFVATDAVGVRSSVIGDKQYLLLKLKLAPIYFAELWDDISERPLLKALSESWSVTIFWKTDVDWERHFVANEQ